MSKIIQPKLRFPEFKENWCELKLSDLLTFKNGINASKEDYGSGYKFINVLDIIQNDFITHDKILGSVQIAESEFKKNIVEYGDILFQRSSETREEVGQANVYLDKDVPATFGGFVIRGKKLKDYDPEFMNALLKTSRLRKEITSKSGGSTRYNVGQDTLSEVSIYTTDLIEQERIASFLRSVDDYISLLKRKKASLERYKDGVMQQIFTQKVRFKDEKGRDFPSWEVKQLGNIYKIVVGGTPSTTNKDYWDGDIAWIGSGELKNNHIKHPTKYISELGLNKCSTYLMPVNTVVLAMTGATLGKIGILDIECTGNQSVAGFLPTDNYSSLFLFYALQNETNQILSYAGGAAQAGINKKNIEQIQISFPCKKEQDLVSASLEKIDVYINHVNSEIHGYLHLKKGLIRKMFI